MLKRAKLGVMIICLILGIGFSHSSGGEMEEWDGPGLRPSGSSQMWSGISFNDSVSSTGADRLHAIGITGYGVSAAIMDATFDTSHEALRDRILFDASAGFSYADGLDAFPYQDDMTKIGSTVMEGDSYDIYRGIGEKYVALPRVSGFESESHGTHVAGTVSAMAPGAGLVLINPAGWSDASSRTTDDFIALFATTPGLGYVASIADQYNIVSINNSWGDQDFVDNDRIDPDRAAAFASLSANGVIVVFATGNDGVNALGRPSNQSGVVSVGALAPNGFTALFSNQNADIAIFAPGVGINSSIPFGDAYNFDSGTSMASPHVTGAIALLASGARNASTDEVMESILASADRFLYEGNRVFNYSSFKKDFFMGSLLEEFAGEPLDRERTQDEWRDLQRKQAILRRAYDVCKENDDSFDVNDPADRQALLELAQQYLDENELFPDLGPLGTLEFRFLRVDKAYMLLTENRMLKRAAEVTNLSRAASAMLTAYAGVLGADIDQDTADIFQRLDAQNAETLADAGRRMSPQWTSSSLEYAQLGVIGRHRAIGRRGDARRTAERIFPAASFAVPGAALANPRYDAGRRAELWVEGFGSFANRGGTRETADYNGRFAGVTAGLEWLRGDCAAGIFGSWADFRADGSDGRADGDWYGAGLYGRLDRDRWFAEASAAYNYGSYDSSRALFIPGARFTTPTPDVFIDLPALFRRAAAKNRVHGFSGRLAFGMDALQGDGWAVGPRAEGALAYGRVSAFRDSGAGSLDLAVNAYHSTFAEGGLGIAADKAFPAARRGRLVVSAKVMATYGGSFGGRLSGRFQSGGPEFDFKPKQLSGIWCLPEAGLTWEFNERMAISAYYNGRFGKRYVENTGTLAFSLRW